METYKKVADFPDYEVSDQGNIRNKHTQKVLKPKLHKKRGYHTVNLYLDKKQFTRDIHRLVALAFIPNENNLEFVDHLDRNKLNNVVSNLRWTNRHDNNFNRFFNKKLLYHCDFTDTFFVRMDTVEYQFSTLDEAIEKFKSILVLK